MATLTIEQQKKLLEITERLPPESCKHIFLTEDQKKNWGDLKNYWRFIGYGLKLYFSGKSVTKGLEPYLEDSAPDLILLSIRSYLKLYELMNFGWVEIQKQAAIQNIAMPANEPGEALEYILNEIAIYHFSYCLMPYSEFSPRKLYKAVVKSEKLAQKESEGKNLTNIEEKSLKNTIKEVQRNAPRGGRCDGYDFRDFCLDVCSKFPSDSVVKDIYDEYQKAHKKTLSIVKREVSPNGCSKKEVWKNGKLTTA